jgi:hypothetical protein
MTRVKCKTPGCPNLTQPGKLCAECARQGGGK